MLRTKIPSTSGIYLIRSKSNGKFYIGQAKNLRGRMSEHFRGLEKGDHHSVYLQRHYNKYGEDDLQFVVVELCPVQDLSNREQFYLDMYKPSFNMCFVANSMLGFKHSNEFRKQVSDRFKGDNNPMKRPEVVAKIRQAMEGRRMSLQSRLALSESKMKHGNHSKHYPKMARTIRYRHCDWCGSRFSVGSQQGVRKYCSDDCANEAKKDRLYINRACAFCGVLFRINPRSDQKYCSYACDKQMRIWKNSATLICQYCGKEVQVRRGDIRKGKKYCSLECSKKGLARQRTERNKSEYMRELNSERMKGENNPNYGGKVNNALATAGC